MNPFFLGRSDTNTFISFKEWSCAFSPGPILNGAASWITQPQDSLKYRTYKLDNNDEANNTLRYQNFPFDFGAPSRNGNPCAYGSSVVWSVFNDADTNLTQTSFFADRQKKYSGLEFQQTVFVFDSFPEPYREVLRRTLFMRLLVVNKSIHNYDEAYIGFWADVDIWYSAGEENYGIDTTRQIVFAYVLDKTGERIPALGAVLLQGPKRYSQGKHAHFRERIIPDYENIRINAFERFLDDAALGNVGPFQSSKDATNFVHNLQHDGKPWIDPKTKDTVKIPFTGDPLSNSGWLDIQPKGGGAGFIFTCGPFTMALLDTQEIVIALTTARGATNLDGVRYLREESALLKSEFENSRFDCKEHFYAIKPRDTIRTAYQFYLSQNYPNPVTGQTTIQYSVEGTQGGYGMQVLISIHDLLGRKVTQLVDSFQKPGAYLTHWDASRNSSGMYMLRMRAGNFSKTMPVLVVK